MIMVSVYLLVVCCSWLAWVVAGLVLHAGVNLKHYLPSLIRGVMEYGKLRAGKKNEIGLLSIPKRWFTHFYMWGVIWNYSLFANFLLTCITGSRQFIPVVDKVFNATIGDRECGRGGEFTQHHFDTFVVLFLLCVQVTRRFYECLFVNVFSAAARMHPVHYLLGMYFYSMVGPTALLHMQFRSTSFTSLNAPLTWGAAIHWHHIAGVFLFLWASYHQHRCHQLLANLRKNSKRKKTEGGTLDKSEYGMPQGDWFELVSSPHYLAEILIYVALVMCQVFSAWWTALWCVLLSTVCTLSLSARQVHLWYKEKFEDYPINRMILVPWLY